MKILGKRGEELTNFSINLSHIYKSAVNPADLVLQIVVSQDRQQQSLQVSYGKLDQLDIERLVPGCVYLAPRAKSEIVKKIRLSVAEALQLEAQVGMLYTQSGWYSRPTGQIFVAGGAIISSAEIAAPSGDLIFGESAQLRLAVDSTLPPEQAAEQLLRSLVTYENYAIPTFAYTLYSMLHSIWSEANLPTACVLNLIGTQGFGKTTLARNFCALYDDTAGRIADFYDAQSTQASVTKALCEAKDRIVVVDDLCKSSSPREMQKRRDLAASILRIAANETPVSKMAGGGIVTATCLSGLVMTGELPLEVPSDVTRCVIIDVKKPLRNGKPEERTIAATAVAAYIQWLCAHFSEEMNHLRNAYSAFSERDATKSLWRLKKSLFQLDWVFDSFLRFAKSVAAISEVAQRELEEKAADIFQGIFSYEEHLVQKLENGQPFRWPQLIMEGARTGAFPFKLKSNCICVTPSNLTNYLRLILQNPAIQEQEIINKLKGENLLIMDKSGKSTKKVSGIRMLNIKIAD